MFLFGGVQIVTVLCSIVRTKAIALWLGAAGMGLFAIYYSVFQLISTLSQLGLRSSAVRDISQSDRQSLPLIASVVRRCSTTLGLIGSAAMLLLSPLLSYWYFGNLDAAMWFMLLAPMVLLLNQVNSESALMQGTSRLRLLARTTVLAAVGGTLLSLPLYYFMGLDSVVPGICMFALANWIGVYMWRVRIPAPEPRPDSRKVFRLGRDMIMLGIYMTASTLITQGVSLLFITYLQHDGGVDEVGYFQAGFTLVNQYIGLIFTAIGMEYYPRLASAVRSLRATRAFVAHETSLVLWAILGPATLFIAANILIISILYQDSFAVISPFIVMATVGTVFRAVSWCVAMVMLARGDGRIYIVTELISALIYLGVNIVMYRTGGIAGMGYAYMIWYLLYTVSVYAVYRYRYCCRLPRRVWGQTAAVTAAITLCAVLYMCGITAGAWCVAIVSSAVTAVMLRRMTRNKSRRSSVSQI